MAVFYSGHGVPGLKSRKGYLLPVDADPDLVELNGYPIDVMLVNLTKIDARLTRVFVDACFSGDSPNGMLLIKSVLLSISTGCLATIITVYFVTHQLYLYRPELNDF